MGNWVLGRNSVALQSRAGVLVVVMGDAVLDQLIRLLAQSAQDAPDALRRPALYSAQRSGSTGIDPWRGTMAARLGRGTHRHWLRVYCSAGSVPCDRGRMPLTPLRSTDGPPFATAPLGLITWL